MDLNCLIVSGISAARTTTVSATIDVPQPRPDVYAFLEPRIVKWWKPDAIFFDAVPLTATGKIDKKTLRSRYKDCLQPQELRATGT